MSEQVYDSSPIYDSVDAFKSLAYTRVGIERLPSHLEDCYGIRVAAVTELDMGVLRVDRHDGAAWVARVFPAVRPLDAVEGDTEILRFVAEHDFPAERCASADACSTFEGQGVVVTEYVAGHNGRGDSSASTLHRMGALLGRLHTFPARSGAMARDAGSWHSLSVHGGSRSQDIAALQRLLADATRRAPADQHSPLEGLRQELASIDVGRGLPTALTHPDFVTANVIKTPAGGLVLVDWTGAGSAPRIVALGLLLSTTAGDLNLVDAVVAGYRAHVALESDELARLPDSIRAFELILACWGIIYWGAPPTRTLQGVASARERSAAIAVRVRERFAS
jgi:Ser/Thr protein kinase RdoA (MazF antagonist)